VTRYHVASYLSLCIAIRIFSSSECTQRQTCVPLHINITCLDFQYVYRAKSQTSAQFQFRLHSESSLWSPDCLLRCCWSSPAWWPMTIFCEPSDSSHMVSHLTEKRTSRLLVRREAVCEAINSSYAAATPTVTSLRSQRNVSLHSTPEYQLGLRESHINFIHHLFRTTAVPINLRFKKSTTETLHISVTRLYQSRCTRLNIDIDICIPTQLSRTCWLFCNPSIHYAYQVYHHFIVTTCFGPLGPSSSD
jgi:hypothetical protein